MDLYLALFMVQPILYEVKKNDDKKKCTHTTFEKIGSIPFRMGIFPVQIE